MHHLFILNLIPYGKLISEGLNKFKDMEQIMRNPQNLFGHLAEHWAP